MREKFDHKIWKKKELSQRKSGEATERHRSI